MIMCPICKQGDTVNTHVTTRLTNNGTTMHCYGLRQNYALQQDSVPLSI